MTMEQKATARTVALWALSVLGLWFTYEARELRRVVLEGQVKQAAQDERLNAFDARLDRTDVRVERLEDRFEKHETARLN